MTDKPLGIPGSPVETPPWWTEPARCDAASPKPRGLEEICRDQLMFNMVQYGLMWSKMV